MRKLNLENTKIFISENLKIKFIVILILNIFDALMTDIGILNGYCIELNPITNSFIDNFPLFVLLKILLPSILILIILYILDNRIVKISKIVKTGLNFAFFVYIFLTVNHFYVLLQLWYHSYYSI